MKLNLKNKKNFKKVVLVGKYHTKILPKILYDITNILKKFDCDIFLEFETAKHFCIQNFKRLKTKDFLYQTDLIIVIGGDGTLLSTARKSAGSLIPIIGINMGTLGYMTDISLKEAKSFINAVMIGQYEQDFRYLLQANVYRDDIVVHQRNTLALNDIVFNRCSHGMIELAVNINGQFMYKQRSDGLILATPTGSTAYSMSVGGPILHPSVSGIILSPIAPHSLLNRPIVLPSNAKIDIKIVNGKGVSVNFDMQSSINLQIGDKIFIWQSRKKIILLHPLGHSGYRAMRKKLHWNESTF